MAVLLDPEARAADDTPTGTPPAGGKLREPVFFVASMLRGLGAAVNDTNNLTGLATNLGQTLFYPPSVFNYFPPGYLIPATITGGATLLGPEFLLNTPSNAVTRYNTVNSIIYGTLGTGTVIDLTPFANLGNNPASLFTAVSNAFFYGQLPLAMQNGDANRDHRDYRHHRGLGESARASGPLSRPVFGLLQRGALI